MQKGTTKKEGKGHGIFCRKKHVEENGRKVCGVSPWLRFMSFLYNELFCPNKYLFPKVFQNFN